MINYDFVEAINGKILKENEESIDYIFFSDLVRTRETISEMLLKIKETLRQTSFAIDHTLL